MAQAKMKPRLVHVTDDLSEKDLNGIPVAKGVEVTFRSEKALQKKRRFIYGVTRNNAANRRWRTIRTIPKGLTLLIIRIS